MDIQTLLIKYTTGNLVEYLKNSSKESLTAIIPKIETQIKLTNMANQTSQNIKLKKIENVIMAVLNQK